MLNRLAHPIRIAAVLAASLLALPSQAHADARFRNLIKESGLPAETVFATIQDSHGYIWFASGNGLERYDGYKLTQFKHKPGDPDSIASDFVKTLYEDRSGRLWVGTYGGGLDLYQPESDSFRHYRHKDGDNNSIASDKINVITGEPDGNLLIGTYDSGLDEFNPDSGAIRHYTTSDGSGLSNNRINAIMSDSRGETWLATNHGLDEVDLAHRVIHAYLNTHVQDESNVVWGMAESEGHELLLATVHGLHSFLPGTALFDQAPLLKRLNTKLANDPILNVSRDLDGNIWIAGTGDGLYLYQRSDGTLNLFKPDRANSDSLSSLIIYNIYQDRDRLIWIGTDVGVDILDPRLLGISYITSYGLTGASLSATNHLEETLEYRDMLLISTAAGIYSMRLSELGSDKPPRTFARIDPSKYGLATALDHSVDDDVLLGTNRNYLFKFDRSGRVIKKFLIGAQSELPFAPIRCIRDMGDGIYYLGTFGNGLLRFDSSNNVVVNISGGTSENLLKNDQVETMLALDHDLMLAGTFRGLFKVDTRTGSSTLVSLWDKAAQPVIQALFKDVHGNIWVGTYEGLWELSYDGNGAIARKEYFPKVSNGNDAQILAIEQDDAGNLWLASNNALLRFNPVTGQKLSLGRDQGMLPLEYYSYNHTHTSNGWLWFGGPSYTVGFKPEQVNPNLKDTAAIFNGVTVYRQDKPVSIPVSSKKSLELSYQDSIVTFDLSAADFAEPEANTFSYRLLGFRSEWTAPSVNHQITFTNLNPGRYRLEVRAANNWGTWSTKPAALDIVILPPWWRTWWAYTLYFLIIIGSSIGYVYSLKRKIEREKQTSASLREANEIKSNFVDKLQTQVAAATKELRETLQGVNLKNAELEIAQKRAAEGEQIKSQFLANMSHELRTPLTGVLGYTKLLGSTHLNSEQKDYVGTIRQSSETLLAIINDTLDHSRLEAGKLLIDEVDFDLLEVIESTLELVAPTAYQKRLELIRVVPPEVPLQLRGDPLRLRQVLTNLLSNAIKFTEHGSVSIQLRTVTDNEREATIAFTVNDTGIGIPAGELPQLFHAYARSRISTRHHVEGTGLGLSICKKLLDLMGGTIQVKSRVGSGTSFDFQLTFKQQKNAQPRSRLPKRIKVLLYDMQPLSNQAWQACLTRLGAEVENAADLESAVTVQADAAVMVLTERELTQLNELKRKLSMAPPPMLVLAPRIDRQALKDLSEALYHRVLSKTAREKTLYLELQSLLQTAVHDSGDVHKTATPISPGSDAPLVLIADDNRINRRLLVTMLNHAGFRVAEASNGLELLDMAARGPWDAALLDIHMPGMDGLEAAAKLRASMGDKLPPVIAMSADVMPETRKQLDGVMDDFLVKPFSEQELVEKLRWHLDRHARKKRGELQPS